MTWPVFSLQPVYADGLRIDSIDLNAELDSTTKTRVIIFIPYYKTPASRELEIDGSALEYFVKKYKFQAANYK